MSGFNHRKAKLLSKGTISKYDEPETMGERWLRKNDPKYAIIRKRKIKDQIKRERKERQKKTQQPTGE